ncbi:MAG: hypothetical protein L6Q99_14350 [Planctomycetes bacterium]|nr:hypothetical protein [Planctomycetota bacterium]
MPPVRYPLTTVAGLAGCSFGLVFGAFGATTAHAQGTQQRIVFSVDFQGPTIGRPDSVGGVPMTEGDVLLAPGGAPAYGPLPAPEIALTGGQLGLSRYSQCVGHAAGDPCRIEVDALSDGLEPLLFPSTVSAQPKRRFWFSVDEYAIGIVGPPPAHAQVASEFSVGDSACDIFVDTGLPVGPLPPGAVQPNNVALIDGNGTQSATGFVQPGLGLVEPTPPTLPQQLPNVGDNVDALDVGDWAPFPPLGAFFSLDAGFPDPYTSGTYSGSAVLEGKRPGDVLRIASAGSVILTYANATQLGLDLAGPIGSDDLDALVVRENGTAGFQPSQKPFDWYSTTDAPGTDMVLFSVRRGSAVVGQPDSIFGLPIEPGDILTTPLPVSQGGLSPFPGIFIAAENLGLRTQRSGAGQRDELDALELLGDPWYDCNKNGIDDAVDIANGTSVDSNANGIPDECESPIMRYCWCTDEAAPCGNVDNDSGCANSTGVGATLTTGGTSSVGADDLTISVANMPTGVNGIMFMGDAWQLPTPFKDGARCVYGKIFRYPVKNTGVSGSYTYGPGLVAYSTGWPLGTITAGSTWYFQGWYRNQTGPCGQGTNLSNAVQVDFVP